MRILIADDDVTSRLTLKAILSKDGHECLCAEDGTTAWEMLSSEGIEVLLSDWMMPGVDGPELCRRVREELSASYIYIVLVTGLGDPEQVLEGMQAGADDYLVKPVRPFAVRTRMVAAERVTALHRQVAEFRAQLERANVELLGQSLTDALTGLGNRRRMEEDLTRAHARARRTARSYCVTLFDIDHFKLYNDRYGHLAGDEALRNVAWCLDKEVRAGESIYRYGGEEFLLLMPDCGVEGAVVAAGRIRTAVAEMAIPHDSSPAVPAVLTLSAGVSCWTAESGMPVEALVEQADRALYQAKTAGRNRLHVAALAAAGSGASP